MYHVVLAVAPDDTHREEKVHAVASLPGEAVRVTAIHVAEPGTDVTAVPAVADTLSRFEAAGVEATAVRGEGRPTEALLERAHEADADAVCVAGRQKSPAGKRQLHPGAQQVLLKADCPVLVTGEAGEGAAEHV
jgi:nucleotide-binding universal stress UspA family protein